MKKPKYPLLVILTAVFAAFTLGLLVGRSQSREAITVNVPQRMLTEPVPTQPEQTLPAEEIQAIVFPIDLNRAGQKEFMALPGIGEVLAERILAYRTENGSFTAVEQLLNVDGIGKKRLEEIWDLITIGGEQ